LETPQKERKKERNKLQDLEGEQLTKFKTAKSKQDAHPDILANSVWTKHDRVFQDVRISYPLAAFYLKQPLAQLHRNNEGTKNRAYVQRVVEVEHGSFINPLAFTTSGGMGPQTTVFFKYLAHRIAVKRNEKFADVMGWIRARIAFALARSMQVVLRGCRSRKRTWESKVIAPKEPTPLAIVQCETGFDRELSE
jgi:hypothetical protein